jgi:DNA segregation ATPase FtsK/SpoIIIE, S-DNA-T family
MMAGTPGMGGAEGTLASAAEAVDLAIAGAAAAVTAGAQLARDVVGVYGQGQIDARRLSLLDSTTSALEEAFTSLAARLGHSTYLAPVARPRLRPRANLDLGPWLQEAAEFRDLLRTARRPLTEAARYRRYDELSALLSAYYADAASLRYAIAEEIFETWSAAARARQSQLAAERRPLIVGAYSRIPRLPPGIAAHWDPPEVVVPGPGRPRLCVGAASFEPVAVTILKPGLRALPRGDSGSADAQDASQQLRQTLQLLTAPVPLILDLDRDGGLKTDDADLVASIALRLLALLPANMLKIALFDPRRLGESAAALFTLDEVAPAVIGDKVFTTEQELSDLLARTEAHITMVTQKYLQGTHESLTAYNAQAGEVAEPYRLLVLYDYPAGFQRTDGQFDLESSARLRKVIEMGPRCGVYTLLVVEDPAAAAAWTQGDRPGQTTQSTSGRLPSLFRGRVVEDGTLSRLLGVQWWGGSVDGTVPSPARNVNDMVTRLTTGQQHPFTVSATGGRWIYAAPPPLSPAAVADLAAHAQRMIASAVDIQVTPQRVAELARARQARDVARGIRAPEVLPEPADAATWWRSTSARGVEACFGRTGASDVAVLGLDSENQSNVLLGGRPGAGKSVWLHAVIASLCQRYSPEELSLYLVDFKEGVEFKAYAAGRLPHARVVAVESEREFGLSVLLSLDAEITRRGNLLRGTDGRQVEIGAYRRHTGLPLPRIVLIIDEFHVLFERDDKLAATAGEIFERIVRQGRAFGIHTILASQTLAGTSGLGRHIFNLIPVRVALQSSDADSRLLLADDNAEAHLLGRPGEGILNTRAGLKDANQRFQTAFWDADERAALVGSLRRLADARGFAQAPAVFEGRLPAPVGETPLEQVRAVAGRHELRLPVGLPLTLDPPLQVAMRREPCGNLLMLMPDEVAESLLAVLLAELAGAAVPCDVLDFGAPDAAWTRVLEVQPAGGGVTRHRSRAAAVALAEVAKLVEERQDAAEYQAPARVVLLAALHRAREFDANAYDSEQNALLERVLRDGPDVGVHVIAWCDKAVSLDRKLSASALRDFGLRLLTKVDRDTSFRLIDSDAAADLPASQAVFDDYDRGEISRLRWFTAADDAWISAVLSHGAGGAA